MQSRPSSIPTAKGKIQASAGCYHTWQTWWRHPASKQGTSSSKQIIHFPFPHSIWDSGCSIPCDSFPCELSIVLLSCCGASTVLGFFALKRFLRSYLQSSQSRPWKIRLLLLHRLQRRGRAFHQMASQQLQVLTGLFAEGEAVPEVCPARSGCRKCKALQVRNAN